MNKNKTLKIFDLLYVLFLFTYFLLFLIYPDHVQFHDTTAIFIKNKVSYLCIILSFVFFIINTYVALLLIKKKLGYNVNKSSKQLSIEKKHPKKIRRDNLIIMIVYFLISSFFILFTFFNRVYARYELSDEGIVEFNFMNRKTSTYRFSEFKNFEIGTLVYTGRNGTTKQFYIKVNGPINVRFMKSKKLKDVLYLMKKLKENYKVFVDRKEYKRFINNSDILYWSQEEKNLIREVFE